MEIGTTEDVCSICMDGRESDRLVTACACRGSMKYLHVSCGLAAYEAKARASNSWLHLSCPTCKTCCTGEMGQAIVSAARRANEALLEIDNEQSVPVLIQLGNAYGFLGDAARKRDLLERALRIKEREYGPEHREVAATLMGNAYGSLGDAARKRNLLERALRIDEREYGPEHREVAVTLTNLGSAYGSLGDAARGRDLLERALRIQEREYGPEHREVAATLTNLGNAYGSLGDAARKRDLLERALRIVERE